MTQKRHVLCERPSTAWRECILFTFPRIINRYFKWRIIHKFTTNAKLPPFISNGKPQKRAFLAVRGKKKNTHQQQQQTIVMLYLSLANLSHALPRQGLCNFIFLKILFDDFTKKNVLELLFGKWLLHHSFWKLVFIKRHSVPKIIWGSFWATAGPGSRSFRDWGSVQSRDHFTRGALYLLKVIFKFFKLNLLNVLTVG